LVVGPGRIWGLEWLPTYHREGKEWDVDGFPPLMGRSLGFCGCRG